MVIALSALRIEQAHAARLKRSFCLFYHCDNFAPAQNTKASYESEKLIGFHERTNTWLILNNLMLTNATTTTALFHWLSTTKLLVSGVDWFRCVFRPSTMKLGWPYGVTSVLSLSLCRTPPPDPPPLLSHDGITWWLSHAWSALFACEDLAKRLQTVFILI